MSADKPPGSDRSAVEDMIRDCYETWSDNYYDNYYTSDLAYPPVHTKITVDLLQRAGSRTVLDAGCGPASMLRNLALPGLERWGFDLTPSMVVEARRVLGEQGLQAERIWEGSVVDKHAFAPRAGAPTAGFDAAICFGVMPHIPAQHDADVLTNLMNAVRPGGLIAVEARNQLFALFTLNRYSRDFMRDALIDVPTLTALAADDSERKKVQDAVASIDVQFRTDLPPVRKGEAGRPGYDEVLARTHNPLLMKRQAEALGLTDVDVLFYHYHALPPLLEASLPDLFRRASVAMEDPEDWRGYFMASAFILIGRRPQ